MADPIFYSYDETLALFLAYLRAEFPNRATHPLSFLGHEARAVAQLVGALQQAAKYAHDNSVPAYQVDYDGVIRSRCSSDRLDAWAFTFGLPSNRAVGTFGRNAAAAATGGVVGGSAAAGTIIPAGTLGVDPSGLVTVATTAGVTASAFNIYTVACKASATGASGNLPANTVIRWLAPVPGMAPTALLATGLAGGADDEDDLALLVRLLRLIQSSPAGGKASDIRTWVESAVDPTIVSYNLRGYVFGKRNGAGSSDVVICQAGHGQGRDPGSTVTTAIQTVVDATKIESDTVRVLRPRFISGQDLRAVLRITPGSAQYGWDWGGGTVPTSVVSGTGLSLVLSGATPHASLAAAVVAGSKPRVQVLVSGSPIPVCPRVTVIANNSPMAGQHELTLETALPAAAVASVNCYPGSSAVIPVATAVQDYIDGLGPSRQSGYADPLDVWAYVVSVGGIARAALDAVDSAGLKFVADMPAVGSGGVTIQIGSGGSPLETDYSPTDAAPNLAPQLAEVSAIQVIG